MDRCAYCGKAIKRPDRRKRTVCDGECREKMRAYRRRLRQEKLLIGFITGSGGVPAAMYNRHHYLEVWQ